MKNLSLFYSIFLALIAIGCSDNSSEVKRLQNENDSLKKLTAKYSWIINFESIQAEYPSLGEAAAATERWRNHTKQNIMIPASWRFDVADFIKEINTGKVKYFRFYPSLVPTKDTMNLLFVSVDDKGNDNIGSASAPRVYNFSQNCPNVCSDSNAVNSRIPDDCVFVTALKQDKK